MPYENNAADRVDEMPDYRLLTGIERAEVAALAALGSPEGVRAFALMRKHLRPGTDDRYEKLLATIDRLSGPGFAEAAAAELDDEIQRSQHERHFAPGRSGDPIGALALAQLLRDRRLAS